MKRWILYPDSPNMNPCSVSRRTIRMLKWSKLCYWTREKWCSNPIVTSKTLRNRDFDQFSSPRRMPSFFAYPTPARFDLSPLEHVIPHDLLSNCYSWRGGMERVIKMKNSSLYSACSLDNRTSTRKRDGFFIMAIFSIPSLLLKWPFEIARIAFLTMPSPHSKTRNALRSVK